MVLRFQIHSYHEDSCEKGHSAAWTKSSVESALRSAYNFDADELIVNTLGDYVILEGFVRHSGDVERAIEIAEDVIGHGYVRSRLMVR